MEPGLGRTTTGTGPSHRTRTACYVRGQDKGSMCRDVTVKTNNMAKERQASRADKVRDWWKIGARRNFSIRDQVIPMNVKDMTLA